MIGTDFLNTLAPVRSISFPLRVNACKHHAHSREHNPHLANAADAALDS
jgi:hypothetical protein